MKTTTTANTIPKKFLQTWFGWSLVFLLVVSIMGLGLRYYFIGEIPGLKFNNIKHGHSHMAMLGWSFFAAAGLLLVFFIEKVRSLRLYRWVLWLNIVACVGMAISFPIQGYGFFSIFFSTLHLVAAYIFSYGFLRDLKLNSSSGISHYFARWSVIWMLISTIGLWAIAPVGNLLGGLHPLFYISIQWFLHFQFVGWFTYAVIAGVIQHLERNDLQLELPTWAFNALQLSVILTYALSVNWASPATALFYLNGIGVVIQLIAFCVILWPIYLKLVQIRTSKRDWMGWMIMIGLLLLFIRVLIQTAVVIPAVAEIAYTLRMYVIAFIHLIMLGMFTLIAAGLLGKYKIFLKNRASILGWKLFFVSFVFTEVLLFGQGTLLWAGLGFISDFHHFMFWGSVLFPLGMGLVVVGQFMTNKINV